MQREMTKGNPLKIIMLFAIPMFVGSVFQQVYNMVDSIVVGRNVGAGALAAVGACAPAYNLILALISGLTTGASVVIAQYFGSGDQEQVKKAYITSLVLVFQVGTAMTMIGLVLSKPLLRILGNPEDVMGDAAMYLMIMCAGILATSLYNGMAAFLRAIGNSLIPLVALIIASILNVGLDLLFVIVFKMGVMGVGIATIISQLISGLYCLWYINHKMSEYQILKGEFHAVKYMEKEMIRIGVPAAISTSIVSLSTMLLQAAVNAYGTTVIAAYTAGSRTEQIFMCLSFAIGSAVGTFCGQNIGANKIERAVKGLHAGYIINIIYTFSMGSVMFLGAKWILRLFTSNPEVISIGVGIVHVTAIFSPVLGFVFIFQNFLRNASDIRPTIWMSLSEVTARGALGFAFSALFGYAGIWWATPVGWIGSMLIGYGRYRSGKWRDKCSLVKNK